MDMYIKWVKKGPTVPGMLSKICRENSQGQLCKTYLIIILGDIQLVI